MVGHYRLQHSLSFRSHFAAQIVIREFSAPLPKRCLSLSKGFPLQPKFAAAAAQRFCSSFVALLEAILQRCSSAARFVRVVYGRNQTVGCSRTVACNQTITLANHFKCTELNPPITEVITITIATITYPNKLGINPKWMNMQHIGSVSPSNIFPYFGHLV